MPVPSTSSHDVLTEIYYRLNNINCSLTNPTQSFNFVPSPVFNPNDIESYIYQEIDSLGTNLSQSLSNIISASYALTASYALSYTIQTDVEEITSSISASYAQNSQTSNFAISASQSQISITASYAVSGGNIITNTNFTSSYLTTSSFNLVSSSFSSSIATLNSNVSSQENQILSLQIATSSFISNNQTSSLSVATASFALNVVAQNNSFTNSYLFTSSFNTVTSSFETVANHNLFTQSVSQTYVPNVVTSSFVLNSQTSSMSVATASYWSGSIINVQSASVAQLVTNPNNSFTASYLTTSSFNTATSSFETVVSHNLYTQSVNQTYVLNSTTASFANSPVTSSNLTGQSGAISVCSITPVILGTFRIGAYVTITAIALDVIQMQVTYTDETMTSRTASLGTSLSGTGAFYINPIDIRASSSPITVRTILTTGTGTISYDVGACIQLVY